MTRQRIATLVGFCLVLGLAVGLLWLLFDLLHGVQQDPANDLLARTPGSSGSLPWNNPQRFFRYILAGAIVFLSALAIWRFRRQWPLAVISGLVGAILALGILSPWSPLAGALGSTAQEGGNETLAGPFSPSKVALFFAGAMALLLRPTRGCLQTGARLP